MKNSFLFVLLLLSGFNFLFSQNEQVENLDEVMLKSSRIEIPFSEDSRTILIISKEDIKNTTATNVADLLQQVAGVDVRRRGVEGMQSDLYIRGGSFDQTLVLIDGFKTENPQTGHHSMNMMIPLENIERIEIIKGPAARVYGQNAFTGAINIITKDNVKNSVIAEASYGSYHHDKIALTGSVGLENSSFQAHYSRETSDGYRYNTDFENQNVFIKSKFNTQKIPIDVITTFMERKFGANGFYASPEAKDQYEETQSSLVGVSTSFVSDNFTFKPKAYWKRGQDMYVYLRHNPEVYRNHHITNKVGTALDATYRSKLGITGFGVDIAKVFVASNNLGDHDRMMVTTFLEQRFELFDENLDITPGVAVTYYSDFDFQTFPGIDIGYDLSDKIKLYGNMGYTYRIPTYTDLYYNSRTELGNPDLNPESALTEELGIKFISKNMIADLAFFYRDSDDLIDYVKSHEDDKWQAENIQNVTTKGIESSLKYKFNLVKYIQVLNMGYTYLDDDIHQSDFPFSKYSLNSMKHQFTTSLDTQFLSFLRQNLAYRFVERPDGISYNVFDAKLTSNYKDFEFSAIFNNILDEEYTETNLVPMPGRNVMFSLKYTLD
ncbi:MAG: TonB-dependent receptor [Bacteroidota bacterium]